MFPKLDPGDAAAQVLGQYGVGPDMAIVVTQACPPSHGFGHARLQRPCLHRVRFHSASNAIDVHTLGPIESYRSLAISTDGTRAAYVAVDPITLDPRPGLFTVAIEQTRLGPIQRIDADIHRDAKVGIGVDGRVVVVESPVQIGDYGSLPTARAFLVPSS